MKKVLVISQKESEAYTIFQNFLRNKLKNKGISSDFAAYKDVEIFLGNKDNGEILVKDIDILNYDFVYLRIPQRSFEVATSLAKFLKYHNKSFGDIYLERPKYGSKLFQTVCAYTNGILQPKTVYIETTRLPDSYEKIKDFLGEPFILKRTTSDKGRNNFIIKNEGEWTNITKELDVEKTHICQEWIPNSGDYRILLDNFRIGSIEIRQRTDPNDHRNNVSLGGSEEFIDTNSLPEDVLQECIEISKIFGLNVCGLDLIQSELDNKFYFIEANHSPGITYDSPESEAFFSNIILDNSEPE